MMSFFKKYIPFTRGMISSMIAYRMRLVMWLFVEMLSVVILYFIWSAIFQNSPSDNLEGFTLQAMLVYLLSQKLVGSITHMNPLWMVSDDYTSGRIAMTLIKPINYRTTLFFMCLGDNLGATIVFTIPYLLFLGFATFAMDIQLTFTLLQIILLIVSIILGILLNFLTNMLYSNIVFYTKSAFGIWQMQEVVTRIFSGELIPLAFFPPWLYTFASFLPFMHVRYTPIMIYMGRMNTSEMVNAIGLQALWVLVMLVLSNLLFNHSMKRLVVQGG